MKLHSEPEEAPSDPEEASRRAFRGCERFDLLSSYAELLTEQGVLRGLIGPREVSRIWSRHIGNSAALLPLLGSVGSLIDVGSGAGLPGLVVAIVRPDIDVTLIEPMERRTTWLKEVVDSLGLANVTVWRGRAEEFHDSIDAEVVTARAVAPMVKLAGWCLPLVRSGGELVALKGTSAAEELAAAAKAIRRLGGLDGVVEEVTYAAELESTHVIRVRKR